MRPRMALLSPHTTNAHSRGKYGYNVKLVAHVYQIKPNMRMCDLHFCVHLLVYKIKCKI
jgi:hypothetical protein